MSGGLFLTDCAHRKVAARPGRMGATGGCGGLRCGAAAGAGQGCVGGAARAAWAARAKRTADSKAPRRFSSSMWLLLGRLQSEGNRFSCWRNICCSLAQHLLQLVGVYSLSAHYAVGSQAFRSTLHPIT